MRTMKIKMSLGKEDERRKERKRVGNLFVMLVQALLTEKFDLTPYLFLLL
jgi:hypothetical protein